MIAEFFFIVNLFARTSYGALIMLGVKEGSQLLLQDVMADTCLQIMPWVNPTPSKLLVGAAMPFVTAAFKRVFRR